MSDDDRIRISLQAPSRYWEIPLPLAAVLRCVGSGEQLGVWVTLATILRLDPDRAYQQRWRPILMTHLNLTGTQVELALQHLLTNGLIEESSAGTLSIPWMRLHEDSLALATRLHVSQHTGDSYTQGSLI